MLPKLGRLMHEAVTSAPDYVVVALSFLLGALVPTWAVPGRDGLMVFWAAVGALGTVATAIIAWHGFERWETRYAREHRAKVAAEAILACSDLTHVMTEICNRYPVSHTGNAMKYIQEYYAAITNPELVQRLRDARNNVAAFIPESLHCLDAMWTMRKTMEFQIHMDMQSAGLNQATIATLFSHKAAQGYEYWMTAIRNDFRRDIPNSM